MNEKEIKLYDELVGLEIATAEELNLVRNCCDGTWEEVLTKVLYARTGYHTIDQFISEEDF